MPRRDPFPVRRGYKRFRMSELPRLEVCPASYATGKGMPDVTDVYAGIGRAFHKAMELATKHGRHAVNVRSIAIEFGADPVELEWLWNRFTFDPHREGAMAEVPVEIVDHDRKVQLRGVLDWAAPTPIDPDTGKSWLEVVDWKTGHRIEQDPEPCYDRQTHAYAVALIDVVDTEKLHGTNGQKAYVRRGDYGWPASFPLRLEDAPKLREELLQITDEVVAQEGLAPEDRSYVMSQHCGYCPGRWNCLAVRSEASKFASAIQEHPVILKSGKPGKRTKLVLDLEITADNAPALHALRSQLEKGLGALKAALKDFVKHTGPIDTGAGKFLALRRTSEAARVSEANVLAAAGSLGLVDEAGRILDWIRFEADRIEKETLDVFSESTLEKDEERRRKPAGG